MFLCIFLVFIGYWIDFYYFIRDGVLFIRNVFIWKYLYLKKKLMGIDI